ncbi:hypothetical protein ABIE26_002091 [Pedobacter africanus]|uniref:Uncharacterized protein n=1 Tax=Pedobacter africanus TaxID=151894 RepID=A0ACC6KZ64_9SPHI|nr:hypothetical protein [Pedobacter africanus]MDR6784521.1 hypothetical protein [Pedobacter africanus]
MQDYYKLHADELQYFKKEVRKAFAAICNDFGLREEKVILTDTDNLFQVTPNLLLQIRYEENCI